MPDPDDLDLWPSDIVAFNHGVSLDGGVLVDHLTGRRLTLNESATMLLSTIDGKSSLEECALRAAETTGWDWKTLINDLSAIVDHLERSSLVHIRRSLWSRLQPENLISAVGRFATLNWRRPHVRRYVPTAWALTVACLRAMRWGLLAGVLISGIMALVFFGQGLGQNGDGWKFAYAFLPFLLFLCLVGHIIIHEAGHLVAMNILAPRHSKYVVVRGLRVSVAHAPLGTGIRRRVAIAGPLAGLFGAQIIGFACFFVPALTAVAPIVNLSGLLHLYSLSPWTADGRMIWKGAT